MRISILVISTGLFLGAALPANAGQSNLSSSGYFDLEAEVSNKDADGKKWTFDQHHLNIINSYEIEKRLTMVVEFDWEHGPSLEKDDFHGSIYVSRSFLEYKNRDALRIRAGKFTIPFGIYNELHDATPTFLSTLLPSSLYGRHELSTGAESTHLPSTGVGALVLGRFFINDFECAYQVHLTNGRGADPSERDDNTNKAIGARLTISPYQEKLRIGASIYRERNGTENNALQQFLGSELEINLSRFQIQTESIFSKLEKIDSTGNLTNDFLNDLGYYVLGAYTVSDRLTAFAWYDFHNPDTENSQQKERAYHYVVGLNFALTTQAFLKGEVHFNRFEAPASKNYELFISSITVAF